MKLVITLAAVLVAVVIARAEVSMGFVGGLNIANVSGTDSDGDAVKPAPDSKMGFAGNVFIEVPFSDAIALDLGVGYSMIGFQQSGTVPLFGEYKNDASGGYLVFPVLLKARIDAGSVLPYIALGPEFGVLMSAEQTVTLLGTTTTTDVKSDTKSLDIGLNLGGGLEFNAGYVFPFIQAGYVMGLSNLVKDPTGDESQKNTGIRIQAGVRIKM
ncbi:MAG: porin family protein [Fibrobacterota bacterium]